MRTKEEISEARKLNRLKNIEKVKARYRQYYLEHKEEVKERVRRRNLAHPEKRKPISRRYRAAHKEKLLEKGRQYYHSHPDKNRMKHLRREFGITLDDYNAILCRQNGVCAICGSDNKGKKLTVDHDHGTGKIRGLLCSGCNAGLGQMRDDVKIIESALNYLKQYTNDQSSH